MKKIFKYRLKNELSEENIMLPDGFEILTIQKQDDILSLWAIVDDTALEIPVIVYTYGTGWEIPSDHNGRYITTLQSGRYVWHYFYKIDR